MNKPKTGMYLWFYAVLAFVLAIFGQTLLCGLLLAFVILTERDSWLTCQVIQALGLCFVNSVMEMCIRDRPGSDGCQNGRRPRHPQPGHDR